MKKNFSASKETIITEVLEKNLFTKAEDAWVYTNDSGQVAISISCTLEGDELAMEIWMLNDDLKVISDKIFDEINAA